MPGSSGLNRWCDLVRFPFGEVTCFGHAEKIQKKSRSRYAGQNEKGGGISRVHDDESGQRCASAAPNNGSLGQIEMADSARQVRDDERKERAIKPRPNPFAGSPRMDRSAGPSATRGILVIYTKPRPRRKLSGPGVWVQDDGEEVPF
jgi:hypothetical protein